MHNLTDLASTVNTWVLRQAAVASSAALPASIVCPVATATLSEYTNAILMDHDRLPPMQEVTIGPAGAPHTVNGHALASEFVYICAAQYGAGSFYLLGESGLFSVGFASLAITPEVPPITLVVTRPDFSSYSIALDGCEHASIFLTKGDAFNLYCTLAQGAPDHELYGLASRFTITRLSKNVGLP